MAQPSTLKGKVAWITGGGSGIGLAAAQALKDAGAKVVISGRSEKTLRHPGLEAIALDVSDRKAVAKTAASILKKHGRIDILVNSAGITGATVAVQEFPIDSWLQVMDVNLNGTFYCCREVVPLMLPQNYGRIVNIASVAGKEGNPKASAYSASKAGVIGFTKSLGKELATNGILVNCITPATFESPILDQLPPSQIEYMRSRIPMGRLGYAEESAALVCWLASEECSFSTAATFDISGGRTTY